MRLIQFTAVRADTGVPLPQARATLYLSGTLQIATMYNAAGNLVSNPVTADSAGLISLAAMDGLYDIQIVSADGRYSAPLMRQVQIVDILGIAGTITSGRISYSLWAELETVTPANSSITPGMIADVPATDGGTHTDPVTQAVVPNSGVYRREGAGWRRIYDSLDTLVTVKSGIAVTAAAAAVGARDEIVGRIGNLRVLPFDHELYSDAIIDAGNNILALVEKATGRLKVALTTDSIIPGTLSSAISAFDIDEIASGFLFPIVDRDRNLVGGWTTEGKLLAQLDERCIFPSGGGGSSLQAVRDMLYAAGMGVPSGRLYYSGDSLTAGAGGGGVSYPAVMATALGLPFVNTGVGGTLSDSIGARQGGIPMYITLSGGAIPAGTSEVDVTVYSVEFTNNQSVQTWDGTLGGVPVTLTRYGRSDNPAITDRYTIRRRSASASATVIPNGTRFLASVFLDNQLDYHYIQAGRNGPRGVQTRDHILSMIDHIGHDRFGILPIKNGANEGVGGQPGAYESIMESNRLIQEAVGWHFADTRKYLASRQALTDAGIAPTSQDLADIAADTIPASLRSESVHGNASYYNIEGLWVSRWHRGHGWAAGF